MNGFLAAERRRFAALLPPNYEPPAASAAYERAVELALERFADRLLAVAAVFAERRRARTQRKREPLMGGDVDAAWDVIEAFARE